ncbi:MAG: prepilin-type N-terminal cleavage/methylation domain-containing protein [Thermoguttaceae bacterium]|nr:prepilin-type N-terminal cleavage/methylation domain-containing protein [Thermoguttaceae bacterium]
MEKFQYNNQSERHGFTLLEILIALAILMLGLAVISELIQASNRQAVQVEDVTNIQVVCQNMLSRILAGDISVSTNVPIPVNDYPDWDITVSLTPAPIPNLVGIRIFARRYNIEMYPSATNPGIYTTRRTPIPGQHFVLKQWVRREDLKLNTVVQNSRNQNSNSTGFETGSGTGSELPGQAMSGYFNFSNDAELGSGQNGAPDNGFSTIDAILNTQDTTGLAAPSASASPGQPASQNRNVEYQNGNVEYNENNR